MGKTNLRLSSVAAKCISVLAAVACLAQAFPQPQPQPQPQHLHQHSSQVSQVSQSNRQRAVFARRAADDSRPLPRSAASSGLPQEDVVIGKFRAPAPEQVRRQRIPKMSQMGSQTMSASFRVADVGEQQPEKIVNGVPGASSRQPEPEPKPRSVSAKMEVSDEGLNYPPSKLSADIYGNVAEIVTAPPEAVENDFLIPSSRRHLRPAKARRSNQ